MSSAAALLHVGSAAAQSADAPLAEVVVTAQKREEKLLDVPIAVTVMNSEMLRERGFTNIQDLAFAVPGVTMREEGPGSYTIFLRGLSNQYGTGALVGVYLDEAPVSVTAFDQLDTRYYDMERVEVLKGPQGTLYGQGSVAGAIRYITKAPKLDRVEGSMEASLATVDGGDAKGTLTGAVNIPVVKDKFALRIAATAERGGGWQDHPAAGIKNGNDQNVINARAKALWQITDRAKLQAMVVKHRNKVKLGQGYENPDRTITVGVTRSMVLAPKIFDYELYNADFTYDFDGFQFLSSTTYVDLDHQYPYTTISQPQTTSAGFESSNERHVLATQFSQEFRLASTGEGPFHWTVGAFYRDVDRDFWRDGFSKSAAGLVTPSFFRQIDTYKSYSGFVDASYDVTERLVVGAGVRYFTEDQTGSDGVYLEKAKFDSTDPRVYARYKVSDRVSVYGSIAKGFRSGGFNRGTTLPDFGPESVWTYEIGVKGSAFDRALDFEIAAYYNDYTDMLRRGLVFIPALNNLQSNTSNIGKAEVKGIEGGFVWRATSQFSIHATGSWIDSEIKSVDATNPTSLPGDPLDYIPKWSAAIGARYEFDLGDSPAFVRLDYNYRDPVTYIDRTSFRPNAIPQKADAIGLIDAGFGVTLNDTRFEVFGTNLANINEWVDPYYGFLNANRTRPRVVGVRVGRDF